MTDSIFAWALPASVGDNDDADATINWLENQNPDTVNNSARAMMARIAELRSDMLELKATGGTSTAYTVTATQQPSTLPNGFTVYLLPHATNTGSSGCTLNVNGLGAKPLRITSASNAAAGDIKINKPIHATYYETGDEFLIDAANTSGAISSLAGSADGQIRWAKGADVASASALALGTDGNSFDVTGTTAITSIDALGVGTIVLLQFDGVLTLTHHATDLVLPGGANITTAAGDTAIMWEYAAGDWQCVNFERASGLPLAAVDEDDMSSDSDTKVPTQQSVKAYVDANGGSETWSRKTAAYTAVAGDALICDTVVTAAFTVTLPPSPNEGDTVRFVPGSAWESNNLTVGRNGNTIMGDAEDLIGNVTQAFALVWDGTDNDWRLF